MHVALICADRPDSLQLRLDTRPAHLNYINGLGGKLAAAGPLMSADGKPEGSLVILDVADLAEARAIADGDPYAKAGLFANVEIRRWNWLIKPPAAA